MIELLNIQGHGLWLYPQAELMETTLHYFISFAVLRLFEFGAHFFKLKLILALGRWLACGRPDRRRQKRQVDFFTIKVARLQQQQKQGRATSSVRQPTTPGLRKKSWISFSRTPLLYLYYSLRVLQSTDFASHGSESSNVG
jgi:hypothetical protein